MTYVYFVQAEKTKLIKIGRAIDVARRLKRLQYYSPDKLKLLGVISETIHNEVSVHKKFALERVQSEWFKPSSHLLRFISDHAVPLTIKSQGWLPSVGTQLCTPGSVGALIYGHRKSAGLTQTDLAEKIGVSRQWIVKAEKGSARTELGLILQVLNALGIPIGIVERKPEPTSLVDEVLRRCKDRCKKIR